MRRPLIILLLLIVSLNVCVAQYNQKLDHLKTLCSKAVSDSDKVVALGNLANFYYIYKLNNQADSILQEQLLVAQLSGNINLVLAVLFSDAITNIGGNSANKENLAKTIQFIQNGIDYSKSKNQYDYNALGYVRMANILRNAGQFDKALYNANMAIGFLQNITSDSVKALIYIELGETYRVRGEALAACTNYNSAFDLTLQNNIVPLQSTIYRCFSEMYKGLGDSILAADNLLKSLDLNKSRDDKEGMVKDYIDLARHTNNRAFIDKAITLSESLNIDRYTLKAKNIMLAYYTVIEKNSEKAISYLNSDVDLRQSYLNQGEAVYYYNLGNIYRYAEKPDSALYYYKLAEPDIISKFGAQGKAYFYDVVAACYQLKHDNANAIIYYEKALSQSKEINNANLIASLSSSLSGLYEQQGDFKNAFIYAKQAKTFKDNLQKLSKERDITLLGVEMERKKHASDLAAAEAKKIRTRNLQYMLITILITAVFVFMIFIGMFPISKTVIKMLGYFFFISLFEFIVLLIDTFLHKITHGEPLKIWLIKIFLIALLVPIQHFLEHRLVRFLESRKLLNARASFSLKKLLLKTKKPATEEADFEENTAVL